MKEKNNRFEPDWQTGPYARRQPFLLNVPQQLLLLCRLMDITPEQLIIDLMDNLACSSWKRENRDHAKARLIEYFIEHGYGQQRYSVEEIKQIFKEMDALGMLFPKECSNKMRDIHVQWREWYHKYWFNKWFSLRNRTLELEETAD